MILRGSLLWGVGSYTVRKPKRLLPLGLLFCVLGTFSMKVAVETFAILPLERIPTGMVLE